MRYLLTIQYNGEKFAGWQVQPGKTTIQGEIERAIEIATKCKVNLVGSGRTDAGVNALCQVAHFDIDKEIKDEEKFVYSLNGILDNDIKILSIKKTDVHARFSAKKKTYMYKMYKSKVDLPLKFKALRVDNNIDFEAMKSCAKLLVGTHDFKNFCASNSSVDNTVRQVYSCKFVSKNEDIDFFVTGNGFLYKMVRNIVGLLLEVGKGKIDKEKFLDYAFSMKNSKKFTVPAQNLYLYDVKYQ